MPLRSNNEKAYGFVENKVNQFKFNVYQYKDIYEWVYIFIIRIL